MHRKGCFSFLYGNAFLHCLLECHIYGCGIFLFFLQHEQHKAVPAAICSSVQVFRECGSRTVQPRLFPVKSHAFHFPYHHFRKYGDVLVFNSGILHDKYIFPSFKRFFPLNNLFLFPVPFPFPFLSGIPIRFRRSANILLHPVLFCPIQPVS